MTKFIKSKSGWRVQFCAANGKIVAWTETYKTKRAAVRACELVKEIVSDGTNFRECVIGEDQEKTDG